MKTGSPLQGEDLPKAGGDGDAHATKTVGGLQTKQ